MDRRYVATLRSSILAVRAGSDDEAIEEVVKVWGKHEGHKSSSPKVLPNFTQVWKFTKIK